ncbi:MAG TPA: DUF3604 domain-containing protein [Clostridia bacterium]|nr:DUF3604 domain-containing protein [Clostridia bacterium]
MATINPQEDVQAGSAGTWQITYITGQYGIDDGGQIQLMWVGVSDWEEPQFDRFSDYGYTTVSTSGKAKVSAQISSSCPRPFENGLIIKVYDGCLKEGDRITITLGDRSKGSPGIRTQTYIQSDFHYKVLVDPYGTRVFREIPWAQLNLNVVSGPPNEIQILIPSIATVEDPFSIVVRCLDEWGNPCSGFAGTIEIEGISGCEIFERVQFSTVDFGVKRIEGFCFKEPGTYYVKGRWVETGWEAVSNGCDCQKSDTYRIYWGDMHGQNALGAGVGNMDEYLSFARNPSALDFCGWQGNDFEVTAENWEIIKDKIRSYHEPGRFVTFLGYEWSGVTPAGGDHNIYYSGDDGPLYHSHQWIVHMHGGNPIPGMDRYPIDNLWKSFKDRKDVMAVPHVGGRYANFDFYDPEFIKVIEIHSHHGTFEWFALDALSRGMKVGFIAGSDDHTCRPGLSYPMRGAVPGASFDVRSGFTAVFAKELTRESIWEAIMQRRCYATTFARILLDVRSNGHMMGEEFDASELPVLNIRTVGSVPIDYLEILRGTEVVYRHDNIPVADNKNGNKRIRFAWGGVRVRTRKKSTNWTGSIQLDKGFIVSAKEYAFDRPDQGITYISRQMVEWKSTTSGDNDGVILEIEAPDDARLSFNSRPVQFEILNSDISASPTVINAGGVNLKVSVSEVGEVPADIKKNEVELKWSDLQPNAGINPYWVKVVQSDGNMAWSSPIYINYQV